MVEVCGTHRLVSNECLKIEHMEGERMIIKVLDLGTRIQRSEFATRLAITYAPSKFIRDAANRSCSSLYTSNSCVSRTAR